MRRPALDQRQARLVVRTTKLAVLAQGVEPVEAQIIRAAFHVSGREGYADRLAQKRQVLEKDLLLKMLGTGGDEYTLAAQDGGNEISEGFARACACLGQQDATTVERSRNCGGHLALAIARLKGLKGSGEGSIARECAFDRFL